MKPERELGEMEQYIGAERDLERYIGQLRRFANFLRLTGILLLASTLIHLTFAATVTVSPYRSGSDTVAGSLVAFAMIVILAILFEQFSRHGEIIYGELTDELHRRHGDPALVSPQMSFRIALKHFAASTNLPLIPGRFGVTSYILVNLLIVGIVLFRTNPTLVMR